jgi:thymidylate synthase (FAD)
MSVKLVSITKGMCELEGKGAEEIISYCARVSNPSNQENFETAPKLLKYLITHKHWSPFEMASMTVEIKTSRGIAAQILRHRSFAFQEFSQRYSAANSVVVYDARRQDKKNKQNSIDDMSVEDKLWFEEAQKTIAEYSMELYNEALDKGIAKEQARFLLPLSTETTLYMTGTIRSWIHYIEVRADASTQKEHRDIAEAIKKVFCQELPNCAEAMGWNNNLT